MERELDLTKLNTYILIANKILRDEKDVRTSSSYLKEKESFIEYTMSCDKGEIISLAKSIMINTINYGKACSKKYNRKLRIEFLVAFDMYQSMVNSF